MTELSRPLTDLPSLEVAPRATGLAGYLAFERAPSAIAALDGLRALAILLVLARHAVRPFWDLEGPLLPIGPWDAATLLINGWVGVDLFFVLSGFLIAGMLLRRHERGKGGLSIGRFLGKRLLRIAPAYYAVLFLAAAGAFPFFAVAEGHMATRLAYHLLFLQDYLAANIVVVFWSLGVEEKFYLLSPLLVAGVCLARGRLLRYGTLVGLVLLGPLFRWLVHLDHPEPIAYGPFFALFRSPFHLCLDALLVGVLCAFVYSERSRLVWTRDRRVLNAIFASGAAILAVLLCLSPLLDSIGPFERVWQPLVLAVGFGALLLPLALGGGPAAWFEGCRLAVIARLSYCLYLVHLPLVSLALALVPALGLEALPDGQRFVVFLPPFVALSFAAALALHYLVEKPFLILKDRL